MERIGLTASEKKSFENVDDGWTLEPTNDHLGGYKLCG